MIGVHHAHVVGDPVVLAGFMGDFDALAVEEEGHFAVEPLIRKDG